MTTSLLSSAPEGIGSWAEAVEQETRSESVKDGVKTVTEFVQENEGRFKVVTQFKVITKQVPRVVAARKNWQKFGACDRDGSGPQVSTTLVAEEVAIQFTRNRAGEQILDVQEEKQSVKTTSREHCRHCKANDHWSTNCPYKEMYQVEEEVDPSEAAKQEAERAGGARYVVPGMRDGRGGAGPDNRRSDENTCRVTNLPQDVEEAELRELFSSIGRVQRVFIARDKHTNLPKGFAFVTYEFRADAERAIQQLNGYKLYHMVMRVEWTRPNN